MWTVSAYTTEDRAVIVSRTIRLRVQPLRTFAAALGCVLLLAAILTLVPITAPRVALAAGCSADLQMASSAQMDAGDVIELSYTVVVTTVDITQIDIFLQNDSSRGFDTGWHPGSHSADVTPTPGKAMTYSYGGVFG